MRQTGYALFWSTMFIFVVASTYNTGAQTVPAYIIAGIVAAVVGVLAVSIIHRMLDVRKKHFNSTASALIGAACFIAGILFTVIAFLEHKYSMGRSITAALLVGIGMGIVLLLWWRTYESVPRNRMFIENVACIAIGAVICLPVIYFIPAPWPFAVAGILFLVSMVLIHRIYPGMGKPKEA